MVILYAYFFLII